MLASIDWGSAPERLGALGTIGAVWLALHSSARDRKRLSEERDIAVAERKEAAEEREDAATDRKEAADDRIRFREQREHDAFMERRRLAGVVSFKVRTMPFGEPDGGVRHITRRASIRNNGPQPIRLVRVLARDFSNPSPEQQQVYRVKSLKVLPGSTDYDASFVHDPQADIKLELQFVDVNNIRWRISEFGHLEELVADDPRIVEGPST